MTLIVIKLGDEVYNGDKEEEGYVLFRFLNLIMYPHKDDFMANMSEYIDYSDNEELWKEVTDVSTIEQIKYEGMKEKLTEELTEQITKNVTEQITKEGIRIFILSSLEDNIPKERTLAKLQRHYHITKEKAEQYYREFTAEI